MNARLLLYVFMLLHTSIGLNIISRYESNQIGKQCGRTPVYKPHGYKVLNGQLAKNGQFPWAVNIYKYGDQWCGGTLITRRHVLTAAHCVVANICLSGTRSPSAYTVYMGDVVGRRGHSFRVRDIKVHERWGAGANVDYECYETGGDIAIMELERDVPDNVLTTGLVGFGCLASPSERYGYGDLIAHGWGNTLGTNPIDRLVWTTLKIKPYKKCWKNWKERSEFHTKLADDVICTKEVNTDVCHGDSGGPLLQQSGRRLHVVGLVSFGEHCDQVKATRRDFDGGIFTDIRKYLYWLCNETGACYSL